MIRGTRRFWPWFLPYALLSGLHVTLLAIDSALAYPTKLLLMPALLLAVVAVARRQLMVLLSLAILASWLGDGSSFFFPMFDDELPLMLASFGLAHVFYMVAFWRARDRDRRGFLAPLLLYAAAYVVLMAILLPHTGALAPAVLAYGLVLAGTAFLSTRVNAFTSWGGFWFLASDAMLAFRIFWPQDLPHWTGMFVMATYTLGQGLIAYGLLKRLVR